MNATVKQEEIINAIGLLDEQLEKAKDFMDKWSGFVIPDDLVDEYDAFLERVKKMMVQRKILQDYLSKEYKVVILNGWEH